MTQFISSFLDSWGIFGIYLYGMFLLLWWTIPFILIMGIAFVIQGVYSGIVWVRNRGWEWKIPDVSTYDPTPYTESDSADSSSSDADPGYPDDSGPTPGYGGYGCGSI